MNFSNYNSNVASVDILTPISTPYLQSDETLMKENPDYQRKQTSSTKLFPCSRYTDMCEYTVQNSFLDVKGATQVGVCEAIHTYFVHTVILHTNKQTWFPRERR